MGSETAVGKTPPARTVYLNCWHQVGPPTYSAYYEALEHPRACVIWGLPSDLADLYGLRGLRWTHWGSATTRLTGQVRNTHPGMGGAPWSPISATLSRVRRGCRGVAFYTRITFPESDVLAVRLSAACRPA
jgi:hypothetical protein